jgi:hypothetical protein
LHVVALESVDELLPGSGWHGVAILLSRTNGTQQKLLSCGAAVRAFRKHSFDFGTQLGWPERFAQHVRGAVPQALFDFASLH